MSYVAILLVRPLSTRISVLKMCFLSVLVNCISEKFRGEKQRSLISKCKIQYLPSEQYKLSEGENHRHEEKVKQNSHVLEKPAEKNPFDVLELLSKLRG